MGGAIGAVLGEALGVAISPIPVIALILMLFSRAAARNALAFLVGWVAGLAAIGAVVLAIGVDGSADDGSTSGGTLKVVIGALFLLLAARQWRRRPRGGAAPEMPRWMSAVDGLSAARALGLGLVLTVPNPKNLGLTVAAAASIGGAGLDAGQEAAAMLVFVVIASLTIAVPVVAFLVAGERAVPALTALREWLTANSATVMTVLFLVLGAKVLGDGIATLTA